MEKIPVTSEIDNITGRESGQTSPWCLTRESWANRLMAVDDGQAVGAVSSEAAEWYALEWPTIHRNVRRLQARIAQAAKEGRWGKVRALQRLLTHSYSGKVLAVRRVTENTGKKTPGVDREIWDTPEKQGSLPTSFCIQTASHSKGRSRCLSRMTGNCHVRFLEGRTPPMGFGYSIVSRWRGGRGVMCFQCCCVAGRRRGAGIGDRRGLKIGVGDGRGSARESHRCASSKLSRCRDTPPAGE
jgi:hypothetical protein